MSMNTAQTSKGLCLSKAWWISFKIIAKIIKNKLGEEILVYNIYNINKLPYVRVCRNNQHTLF